jgi:hypothetical protein
VREAAHRHRGVVNRQHQGERAKWGVRLGSESHEEKKRGEGGTWRLLTGGEAEWKGNQDQATRRKADGGVPVQRGRAALSEAVARSRRGWAGEQERARGGHERLTCGPRQGVGTRWPAAGVRKRGRRHGVWTQA